MADEIRKKIRDFLGNHSSWGIETQSYTNGSTPGFKVTVRDSSQRIIIVTHYAANGLPVEDLEDQAIDRAISMLPLK